MIVVFRYVPYSAMALYPFILIKNGSMREDKTLIYHEKIHHRQQLELLLIGFYVLYLLNYLYNLLKFRNHYAAYRKIVFEREAFAMDNDFEYLKRRRIFAFVKFFNDGK